MQSSKIGYQDWAIAIYLVATGLKGTSSMKVHRDLGITQKSAWFLAHRIRQAFTEQQDLFAGPAEIERRTSAARRRTSTRPRSCGPAAGRSARPPSRASRIGTPTGSAAGVVETTERRELQRFVAERVAVEAAHYTDESASYLGLPNHQAVRHSAGEYVNGDAHIQGMESFWSMMKRGGVGTYHRMSPKHLDRYVDEFAGRHNQRSDDTIDQMQSMARGLVGGSPIAQEIRAG